MAGTKALTWLILVLVLGGCSQDHPTITVGSKNFIEQVLLGEIAAQHLEQRLGRKVERKLNLGGTLLAHQALVKGEIDLYPEYTGTALTAVLLQPPSSDPMAVFAQVKRDYQKRFGIEWLPPLGFNNTFAMVIRKADAQKYRIESLSDAMTHQPGWILGVGYEFQQRSDGLSSLLKTYHLPINGPLKTMDLGLLYRALEHQEVSMVAGNSTDGALSMLDAVILRDDRACFPPYQAAFAVRTDVLKREPLLEHVLTELSGTFTEAIMRRLNYLAVVEHRSVQEVALQFLKDHNLRE
jgi:osmoprotectant transport system substrate-binding protein